MDNTGTRFDFTVTADNAEMLEWEFSRMSGEAFDVSDATFEAVVRDAAGQPVTAAVLVQHGAAKGALSVSVAALSAAVYAYEVWSLSAEGVRSRVLYGCLTAVSSSAAQLMITEASKRPFRVLRVMVPDDVGSPLLLAWRASSVASAMAAEAGRHAEAAKRSEEAAGLAAERAGKSAEEAAASVVGAKESAQKVVDEGSKKMEETLGRVSEKVTALNAVLAVWDGKIQTAIVLNPETGTLWIGGVDTGCKYQGEPGKAPYISEGGTWVVWSDLLDSWLDTGYPARGDDGFSPYINSLGNWVTMNPLTGKPEDSGCAAEGRDGRDGTAVRRVIVEREEALPQDDELLCNGGVYCYVPLHDAPAVAMLRVKEEGRTPDDRLSVDGVEIELPSAETDAVTAAELLCGAFRAASFTAECSGAVVSVVGDCHHAFAFAGLNESGYELTLHVGMDNANKYKVFAWLEEEDGSSGWMCVGEANDLATAEVAGLVKYATDIPCGNGAPVAKNRHGQMVVPRADYTTPGSVLPSTAETLGTGGAVGFDEAGRMVVACAAFGVYGVVKPSWAGLVECGSIGLREDGSLGMCWATLTQGGAVMLGSELDETAAVPYLLGVGATKEHKLANNLLLGGALKHQRSAAWLSAGMDWLDIRTLSTSAYYLGLVTSNSFRQSEGNGLELVNAALNPGVLGGVVVSQSVSASSDVVPSGKAWIDKLEAYSYSRAESEEHFESKSHAAQTYETKEDAAAADKKAADTYETKADAKKKTQTLQTKVETVDDAWRAEVESLKSGKVDKTPTWEGDMVVTQEEYNAMREHNPKIKYYIIEQ